MKLCWQALIFDGTEAESRVVGVFLDKIFKVCNVGRIVVQADFDGGEDGLNVCYVRRNSGNVALTAGKSLADLVAVVDLALNAVVELLNEVLYFGVQVVEPRSSSYRERRGVGMLAAVAEPAVGSNRKATGSMFGFAEWMCCFRIKRVLLSVVLKRR